MKIGPVTICLISLTDRRTNTQTYKVGQRDAGQCKRRKQVHLSDALIHVAGWHRRTPESKLTKFGEELSIGQTPNNAIFCGDPTRSVRDISDRKLVLPEKVGQNSPKSLKTCYSLRLLTCKLK